MKLSLYIHYPFCLSKCPYCDFNSYKIQNIDHGKLLEAYLLEIENYYKITSNYKISTIFFGGGTPSLMDMNFLDAIIKKIDNCWGIKGKIEISMEANPTTIEINKFKDFKSLGINRLSIGVQALNDEDLKFFGRIHNRKQALEAIDIAQKIFDKHYSIDLIYARPEQEIKNWIKELEEAVKLSPYHISLYQLIVEEGTIFYKNGIKPLVEEKAVKMYEITDKILEDKHIYKYEVSNYARKSYECKHNLNYWNSGEWIGIGAGAHGRLCTSFDVDYKKRYAIQNFYLVNEWQDSVFKKGFGYQEKVFLTRYEFIEEILLMGLRLKDGINLKNIKKYLKINSINNIVEIGHLKKYFNMTDDNLRIKPKYFNLLDSLVLKLI